MNQHVKKLVKSEVDRILKADDVFEEIQQQVDSTLLDLRGNIFLTIASKINQQISKCIDQEVDRRLKEILKGETK